MLLEKRGKNSKVINEINVVPYVDIMLVLLVIFMVVAPLAVQGIDINLPNAPADEIELENSILCPTFYLKSLYLATHRSLIFM